MVTCCAIGCVNRSDRRYCRGVTFHKFPSEPIRRELWIQAVQRGVWQPAQRSVLCSAHFNEEDFDRSSASSVRLRPGAVPTKFPDPNIKSRKSVGRYTTNHYDGFFSLSAQLCELSAAIQKKDLEAHQKEEENIHLETKVKQEVNDSAHQIDEGSTPQIKSEKKDVEEHVRLEVEVKHEVYDPAYQINEGSTPHLKSKVIPENPNQSIGIKRKQPDVVPQTFSESNDSPVTIMKISRISPPQSSKAVMPHRFLEIQLNENEKQKNIKPDILSQVMSCNENLAVSVATISSNIDSTITAIKIPRTSHKNSLKNEISVQKKLAPLPHEFLEVELKVLEEQQPEVKLFLSDEISIRKISGKSNIKPGLTIEPSTPRNMRDIVLSKFHSLKGLNQT